MNTFSKAALVALTVFFCATKYQERQDVPVDVAAPDGEMVVVIKAAIAKDTTGSADDYLAGLFSTLAKKSDGLTTGKQVADLMVAIGSAGQAVYSIDASGLVKQFEFVKPGELSPEDKAKVIETMQALADAAEAVDA
jgi:hypothetical protein